MVLPTVKPISVRVYEEMKTEAYWKWRLEYEKHFVLAYLRGPYG